MTARGPGKSVYFFLQQMLPIGNKMETKNNEKDGNGMDFTVRIAWFLR